MFSWTTSSRRICREKSMVPTAQHSFLLRGLLASHWRWTEWEWRVLQFPAALIESYLISLPTNLANYIRKRTRRDISQRAERSRKLQQLGIKHEWMYISDHSAERQALTGVLSCQWSSGVAVQAGRCPSRKGKGVELFLLTQLHWLIDKATQWRSPRCWQPISHNTRVKTSLDSPRLLTQEDNFEN